MIFFSCFSEVVRAMTYLINNGMIMYWGTSRWGPVEIYECFTKGRELGMIGPICELGEYSRNVFCLPGSLYTFVLWENILAGQYHSLFPSFSQFFSPSFHFPLLFPILFSFLSLFPSFPHSYFFPCLICHFPLLFSPFSFLSLFPSFPSLSSPFSHSSVSISLPSFFLIFSVLFPTFHFPCSFHSYFLPILF